MKKYIIMLFVIAAGVTACVSKTTTVDIKEITGIRYQNKQVNEHDFDEISKMISKIQFQNRKMSVKNDSSMFITTKENMYKFIISNESTMKYTMNDTIYYSKDKENIKKLITYLEGLSDKYRVQNYYHAKIDNHYQKKENDIYIKLDNALEHETQIVIEAKEDIHNLRVHDIEYTKENNTYQDMDLIQDKNVVKKGNKIVVKGKVDKIPSFRIEIQNKYGYKTTFLPYYDDARKEVILERRMED
ncbi:MAG: hypothetical protein KH135_02545 [Firmicutes bacterium]|nr:hypothetical protein [Bacillota bacterium]